MLKFKLGFLAILGTTLLSANVIAVEPSKELVNPGITVSYDLHPHKSETFSNPFFLTINALCTIQNSDPSDVLRVKGLAGLSSINDQPINLGEVMIEVKNHEQVRIAAKPQAAVQITNQGAHLVRAICKTV